MSTKYLIALQENNKTYRIAKIVFYNDGGFAFFIPYCDRKEGVLLKLKQNYAKQEMFVNIEHKCVYSMKDSVKLSFHPDGFVQFSSAGATKLISGRDPITKKPKGLGIFSNPLDKPITTGPTFGGSMWGLTHYKELCNAKADETSVVFTEEDYYLRNCSDKDWNAYTLECFLFEYKRIEKNIRHHSDAKKDVMILHKNFEGSPRVFCHRILPVFDRNYVVGILISRTKVGFASKTGFVISGPAQAINQHEGYALHAVTDFPFDAIEPKSLEYNPLV